MEPDYRYDAHCHIFTLEYLLKEAKNMVQDMLKRTYPWKEPTESKLLTSDKESFTAGKGILPIMKDLLRQLYELLHAALGSEAKNLNFLQEEAGKAFPDSSLRITPLMMDIFYLLAYPLKKDADLQTFVGLRATTSVDMNEFQSIWDEILDDFKSYLESKRVTDKRAKGTYSPDDPIELALALIEKERSVQETFLLRKNATGSYSDSLEFYHTNGFCFHMDNLMELVGTQKDELYPFIAIDPRRTGMVETLLSGSFFTGDKRFYGVKLYPRMGVHPLSKPMDAVYQYCSDNNLPITFHCGMSGFPPGTDWKYTDYGNPANFEPVIVKYPKLRIDFAHLGSSDKSYQWAAKIIDMINKYDNVYTDLSCYVDKDDIDRVKGYCDDKKNPKLINRLMFGTDFDVMYFTGKITMQDYYDHFKSIFSADELKKMMHDNPMRFMNIP